MKNAVIVFFAVILFSGFALAQCPPNIPTNTQAFLADLSGANSALSNCPITLPGAAQKIFGDGTIQINIAMKDGTKQGFSGVLKSGQLVSVGLSVNKYSYSIETDEATVDSLLANSFSNFLTHYSNGDIKLRGGNIKNSIKIFFIRLFGPLFIRNQAPTIVSGQPKNCHDTYLPGWTEYSNPETKKIWDQYSAETDGICQVDAGAGRPDGGNCVYLYEKIQGGATSWLCWYKNE
jgi:hypothetical protein